MGSLPNAAIRADRFGDQHLASVREAVNNQPLVLIRCLCVLLPSLYFYFVSLSPQGTFSRYCIQNKSPYQ